MANILTMCAVMLVPGQSEHRPTQSFIQVRVGPRVQNRPLIISRLLRDIRIRGDNNYVVVYVAPTDNSISYYNKQKWVNRRPLFWRFRGNYPR